MAPEKTTPAATGAAATPAAPAAPRIIPGLKTAPVPEKKSRNRPKKSAKGPEDVAAAVKSDTPALLETAPTGLNPALVAPSSELQEVEEKKTSAVEAVQKRLRAAAKKIQRIVSYEEKTEALNADQQKAVASKPALEATVKELNELLVILKAEEKEDDDRLARIKAVDDKRHAQEVEVAVANAKAEAQSEKILIFQFLHLHGLFTQQNNGFAPAALPSVIANARANDVAAIRMLHDKFANGPLTGGGDDALEALAKIAAGSEDIALLDVTFARVKELIAGLTSPPEPAPITESLMPAGANDSTAALVEGATEISAPSFLQASEITPDVPQSTTDEKVTNWAEEVEEQTDAAATAPPPVTVPSDAQWPISSESASAPVNGHDNTSAAGGPLVPDPNPPADQAWGTPTATGGQGLDWSEEHSGDLPSIEGLAPNPHPGAPVPETSSTPTGDGFQTARGGRRGGGPGQGGDRGRGGFRGGRGGGPFRERRNDGSWGPRDESSRGGFRPNFHKNASGEGRPHFNGNGERGAHRGGRGRGGPRGGPRPNGSPANAAPPAGNSTA